VEVTLHQLSQACMFIYSSHGKWVLPPLLWSFPPTATFTSFPTADCWACATIPVFSSWLVVRDFPSSPLRGSGRPTLFATCLFCCYCLLFSFFFFFPGWGLVCPGGYADLAQSCLWEYHVLLSCCIFWDSFSIFPGLASDSQSSCFTVLSIWETGAHLRAQVCWEVFHHWFNLLSSKDGLFLHNSISVCRVFLQIAHFI
jgi:hypothetical protein